MQWRMMQNPTYCFNDSLRFFSIIPLKTVMAEQNLQSLFLDTSSSSQYASFSNFSIFPFYWHLPLDCWLKSSEQPNLNSVTFPVFSLFPLTWGHQDLKPEHSDSHQPCRWPFQGFEEPLWAEAWWFAVYLEGLLTAMSHAWGGFSMDKPLSGPLYSGHKPTDTQDCSLSRALKS